MYTPRVSTLYLPDLVGDVVLRLGLHRGAILDELHRRHALQRVAEIVADDRLQHFVDEVLHRPDHRDHLRRELVGDVDLHLQIDVEDEAFLRLRHDLFQLLVEIVRLRRRFGPVERQNRRRYHFGLVDPRIDRVLAGAQRLLPDAAVARGARSSRT